MTYPTNTPETPRPSSSSRAAQSEECARDELEPEIDPRVRQRLALRWATQWRDLRQVDIPAYLVDPEHQFVIRGPHDPLGEQALADVLREAGHLAAGAATASTPGTFQVRCGSGTGGLVVLVQGPRWSLVARSGGPVAIVCPEFPDGVSLWYAPSQPADPIAALVSALIALARRASPPARPAVRKNF